MGLGRQPTPRLAGPVYVTPGLRHCAVKSADEIIRRGLLRRGFWLEYLTLGWNLVGHRGIGRRRGSRRVSVALAGFGMDSLIEIGASTVVIWELSGTGQAGQRRALRLIGVAFGLLAAYLAVQSTVVLAVGWHPRHSPAGIGWTAVTAVVMFALAAGRRAPGRHWTTRCYEPRAGSPSSTACSPRRCSAACYSTPCSASGGPTPSPGYVLVFYAAREVYAINRGQH